MPDKPECNTNCDNGVHLGHDTDMVGNTAWMWTCCLCGQWCDYIEGDYAAAVRSGQEHLETAHAER